MSMSNDGKFRVVIVGGGFGGLAAASRLKRPPLEVLLVDRQNYHTFQPLLYQVATAGLEPEEIAHAVRGIFQKQRNFSFRLAEVKRVDLDERRLTLSDGGELTYDYLVLAAGATTHYYGVEGADEHAFTLKSLRDATAMRSHIIRQFERADSDPSAVDDGALTFVVVGGGPTGVEMAGALVELFDLVLKKDFPALQVDRAAVILVEAQSSLLSTFHRTSQQYALKTLVKRGVDVRLETSVSRVNRDSVALGDDVTIPTQTVIWAAGVRGAGIGVQNGPRISEAGRMPVTDQLSLPTHPEVFVIGDLAASHDPDGKLHPQLAATAIQGGKFVADVIGRRVRGRDASSRAFRYRDKGIMATIGRNAAVAELAGGIRTRGFLAWLMWLLLHLVMLIGFRNRINVLVNWAWNYVTYDRSARLILEEPERSEM